MKQWPQVIVLLGCAGINVAIWRALVLLNRQHGRSLHPLARRYSALSVAVPLFVAGVLIFLQWTGR